MTGKSLQSRREALRLSQAELAALLGMTGEHAARTVRRWELGERQTPDTVETLLWLIETSRDARALLETRRRAQA